MTGSVGGGGRGGVRSSSSPILIGNKGVTQGFFLCLLGKGEGKRLMDGSVWMLIYTLRPCPSAGGLGRV